MSDECPYWLPQDPNVAHKDRKRCIFRAGHEGYHADNAYGFVSNTYDSSVWYFQIEEMEYP